MKLYRLRNLQLSGYNPVNVGVQHCRPAHAYGPTTRGHFLLHYIKSGKGTFRNNENTYVLSSGMCFVIRPDEVTYYEADAADPWHYIWIGFTTDAVPKCLNSNDVLALPFLESVFDEIEDKIAYYNSENGENGIREAWLSGKIAEIMARISLHYDRPTETKAQNEIRIVKNYIDTRIASRLSVSRIAEQFHLDRAYLSRRFKEVVGVSPQNYIVDMRLREAAKLMTEHSFTPTEAANAVGYTDIYLFSKMFKRHFCVSPREYKQNNKTDA